MKRLYTGKTCICFALLGLASIESFAQTRKPIRVLHVLTIRPFNPGVVFYKVIVDDGGYEQTFLKMSESPYKRL